MVNQDVNHAFGTLLIPCLKLVVLLGLVVSFFALVRLRADMDAISLFLIPATLCATVILVVPISLVMSSLYEISKKIQEILSQTKQEFSDIETRNYFEHQLKSCGLIRCKVGNMYYMEAEAKLTMLNHTVSALVFLLVNFKG